MCSTSEKNRLLRDFFEHYYETDPTYKYNFGETDSSLIDDKYPTGLQGIFFETDPDSATPLDLMLIPLFLSKISLLKINKHIFYCCKMRFAIVLLQPFK